VWPGAPASSTSSRWQLERISRVTARAGNRRFGLLSALRPHTKAPYKMDFHRETLRLRYRPARPGPELKTWKSISQESTAPQSASHGEGTPSAAGSSGPATAPTYCAPARVSDRVQPDRGGRAVARPSSSVNTIATLERLPMSQTHGWV
jgi:hypothetical protein